MASPIGASGTFPVASDAEGSRIIVRISEKTGVQAENLSLSTWGASLVLANILHRFDIASLDGNESNSLRILELGAGTGLVGVSAAALWGGEVFLTDLPSIVPGIAANISLNRELFPHQRVFPATLDWSQPEEIRLTSDSSRLQRSVIRTTDFKADVILAADTIYSEEHPSLLLQTIQTWLAGTRTSRVILCYPLRMAYIDHIRDFWQLLESSGLQCVDEGREAGDEDWNEMANTPYEWCAWAWKESMPGLD